MSISISAARYGHGHILSYLDQKGVDMNSIELEYGYTALHLACLFDHVYAVCILLRSTRIDPLCCDMRGNDTFHSSLQIGIRTISSFTFILCVTGKIGIHIAAERGCCEIIRSYAQHPLATELLNFQTADSIGWTALHYGTVAI